MTADEPNLLPRHVCAVCGRVLEFWEGKGWFHNLGDESLWDHPPVPVRDTEIIVVEKCDFCYADEPGWVIPARSFVSLASNSGGNWAACDDCERLIRRNDWNGLIRRVKAAWESRHGPMEAPVEAGIRHLYRQLRKAITGPARPR